MAEQEYPSRDEALVEHVDDAPARGVAEVDDDIPAEDDVAASHELPDGLTAREVEILGLVARGLSNRQIGQKLFISEHTAANHIRSILRKSGCANRTEAASYAHRHGLAEA